MARSLDQHIARTCPVCGRKAAYADMVGFPLCLACDEERQHAQWTADAEAMDTPLPGDHNAAEFVTVPTTEHAYGAQYPRSLVEAINAVYREHGIPQIATMS